MRGESERQATLMLGLTPDGFVPKDHPFYTIRSERQFCEQLRYNLLFKWFLYLNVEDEPFHPTTFTKNRERLLDADAARVLLKESNWEWRRRPVCIRTGRPDGARMVCRCACWCEARR